VPKFQRKEWSDFRNSSDRLFSANISCLWQLWICLQLKFNKNKLKGKWTYGTIFHEWSITWTFICDIKIKVWWFIMPWQYHLYSPFTHAMKYVKCESLSHILFSNDNKKADFYWNTWFTLFLGDTILFVGCVLVFIIVCSILKSLVITQTWTTRSTGSTWNHDHAANYISNRFINLISKEFMFHAHCDLCTHLTAVLSYANLVKL
jgi:hypothetical protein